MNSPTPGHIAVRNPPWPNDNFMTRWVGGSFDEDVRMTGIRDDPHDCGLIRGDYDYGLG
jgi:hypothetical protein